VNPRGGTTSRFPLLIVAGALLASTVPCARADDDGRTASNMQLFQAIAVGLADSLATADVQRDSVSVTVDPQDVRWFLSVSAERAFRERGWNIARAPSARYAAEFTFYEMRVTYANPRRSGIFGARLVDRQVSVHAHVRLADLRGGGMRMDGERWKCRMSLKCP
jgi:hypothetical protein